MLIHTLVACSSESLSRRLHQLMGRNRFASVAIVEPGPLWEMVRERSFDLLLVSRELLPDEPSASVLAVHDLPGRPDVVVLERGEDAEAGFRAKLLAAGTLAVVPTALSDSLLAETLKALVQRRREQVSTLLGLEREGQPITLDDITSVVPAMQEKLAMARAVAPAKTSVLILGETGVGKERLARAMHASSPRAGGPFVAVNSGALTEGLVESELFGHERGAFTSAVRTHRGYFERAHGGTLFFDEISEMPYALQVKLLRVLEESTIRRVGGEESVEIDVRVMAASNRDVEAEVRAGRLREDLFYRLSVVSLTLPPLRERREDLPALIEQCLLEVCRRLGRHFPSLCQDARNAFAAHAWPGNVRELLNMLERVVLLCPTGEVAVGSCPCIQGLSPPGSGVVDAAKPGDTNRWRGRPLLEARKEVADSFERQYLIDLLRACHGRVGEAAREAAISTRSMSEMIKRHGLRRQEFRRGPSVKP